MKDLDPANPFDHGSEMFKKNFLKTKGNIPATTKVTLFKLRTLLSKIWTHSSKD